MLEQTSVRSRKGVQRPDSCVSLPQPFSRLGIRLIALLAASTQYVEFLPNFREVLFDVLKL